MNVIRKMAAGLTGRMKKLTTKESIADSARNVGGCAVAIKQDWRNSSKYYLNPEMRSIARYGIDAQTTVRMEECAELISKLKRFNNMVSRTELIENLYEEMVEIYGLKLSDMRHMIDHKMWRMKQKMEAHGERF